MKLKQCSPALAHALVAGWKADANLDRISDDVWGDKNRPFRQIKTLMLVWNRLANNALWDGNYNAAITYLTKHGLARNETLSPSQESEIKKTRKDYKRNVETFHILKDAQRHKNETIAKAGIRNKLRRR